MRNKSFNILIILLVTISFSCEEIIIEPQPDNNNLAVYDEFWNIFNEKYAMFDFKNVDWDQVRSVTRPLVDNTISKDSLFTILGSMTISLRDAHTNLIDITNFNFATFDNEEGFPTNLDDELITTHYLQGNEKILGGFTYIILPDNIGYIQFRDFEAEVTDQQLDQILTEFKDTQGIILDVRGNGGGDPFGAGRIASHFTTERVFTGMERFKTGPGRNDFSDSRIYLEPADGEIYTKPVKVLTNRQCYSATTTMIYLMNPLPHVTFIGSRTGGGSGSVADGQLLNGWIYSLSTSEFIDYEGRGLDDGFDPDIEVNVDESVTDQDEIIERAIQEIL